MAMIPEQLTFTGEAVPVPKKPQSFAQIRRISSTS